MELTVEVLEDPTGYWSRIRELPGCFAAARTLGELREALGDSIGLYLWDEPVSLGELTLHVGELAVEVTEPDGAHGA